MNSQEQSKQNKDKKPGTEEERRREQAQAQEGRGLKPTDRKSDRPESDGEDFNQGGSSLSRTEATGEDF